MSGADWIGLRL